MSKTIKKPQAKCQCYDGTKPCSNNPIQGSIFCMKHLHLFDIFCDSFSGLYYYNFTVVSYECKGMLQFEGRLTIIIYASRQG